MKRIVFIAVFTLLTLHVMAQNKIVQTAGRVQLGDFAPPQKKIAELNDDVLFGEVCGAEQTSSVCAPRVRGCRRKHRQRMVGTRH